MTARQLSFDAPQATPRPWFPSVAVANAQPTVLEQADVVTTRSGGAGAVREVCDLMVESREGPGA
jgi:hypothetical protein